MSRKMARAIEDRRRGGVEEMWGSNIVKAILEDEDGREFGDGNSGTFDLSQFEVGGRGSVGG